MLPVLSFVYLLFSVHLTFFDPSSTAKGLSMTMFALLSFLSMFIIYVVGFLKASLCL